MTVITPEVKSLLGPAPALFEERPDELISFAQGLQERASVINPDDYSHINDWHRRHATAEALGPFLLIPSPRYPYTIEYRDSDDARRRGFAPESHRVALHAVQYAQIIHNVRSYVTDIRDGVDSRLTLKPGSVGLFTPEAKRKREEKVVERLGIKTATMVGDDASDVLTNYYNSLCLQIFTAHHSQVGLTREQIYASLDVTFGVSIPRVLDVIGGHEKKNWEGKPEKRALAEQALIESLVLNTAHNRHLHRMYMFGKLLARYWGGGVHDAFVRRIAESDEAIAEAKLELVSVNSEDKATF